MISRIGLKSLCKKTRLCGNLSKIRVPSNIEEIHPSIHILFPSTWVCLETSSPPPNISTCLSCFVYLTTLWTFVIVQLTYCQTWYRWGKIRIDWVRYWYWVRYTWYTGIDPGRRGQFLVRKSTWRSNFPWQTGPRERLVVGPCCCQCAVLVGFGALCGQSFLGQMIGMEIHRMNHESCWWQQLCLEMFWFGCPWVFEDIVLLDFTCLPVYHLVVAEGMCFGWKRYDELNVAVSKGALDFLMPKLECFDFNMEFMLMVCIRYVS